MDINPVSQSLLSGRLSIPEQKTLEQRLNQILSGSPAGEGRSEFEELLVFYHPRTLDEICHLRSYLLQRAESGSLDALDRWIRMVTTTRLTGHSKGFLSVYTLPPNQAVSIDSQRRINQKRGQTPEYRSIRDIVLSKTRSLCSRINCAERRNLEQFGPSSSCFVGSCDSIDQIPSKEVDLIVTSPPFLDVVDYRKDNWLRCWFHGIDSRGLPIWQLRNVEEWSAKMKRVFEELYRIVKPGGWLAFEVGEIRKGSIKMETLVLPIAEKAGFSPACLMINQQEFTKTANCWGVSNSSKGTNTNRILVLQKG